MQETTNVKEIAVDSNIKIKELIDKKIQEKILESEEDYKNGKVKNAEDVFKEWELKYGI